MWNNQRRAAIGFSAAMGVVCGTASAGTLTGDCEGWRVSGESHFSFPFTILVTASLVDVSNDMVVSSSSGETSLPAGGGGWNVSGTWPDAIPEGDYRIEAVESVRNDDTGIIVLVFNLVFPNDGTTLHCVSTEEGCTPGYWRQEQHFDSWPAPYTPGTLFSDVFEDAFPGLTLLDVVDLGGGGLNALGRHTVAALLNGASPDVNYPFTDAEVIDLFNDVFPGSDEDYEALKDIFEAANEAGCPLNGFADVNADGGVNIGDLLFVLGCWGTTNHDADCSHDGVVGMNDLLIVLQWWGH
jgi:hypothetical protein